MDAIISSTEVLARVSLRDAVDAIERAFAALDAGHIGAPVALGVSVPDGTFHVKACAASPAACANLFVAKINSNFPANPARHGIPTIQGVVAVFDAADGRLRALLDSPSVTSLRTAATTGVAIRHLARKGSRVATVVGCGALGWFHVRLLAECGSIERVNLFDTDEGKARALADSAREAFDFECVAVTDLRAATRFSDVIVTCTSSRTPFLEASDVSPGTFIAAVGADNEQKSEIAPSLLAAARIVADQTAQCMKTGDLRNAAAGNVCGELVDVVRGRVARTAGDEIVIFDSSGLAVEDLALCALILQGGSMDMINFDTDPVGSLPAAWTAGVTGRGAPKWAVEKDPTAPSAPNVLKQSGSGDFPWCVRRDKVLADGFVEVKFKPLSGKSDQAGGLVWRWKDGDNYYVARANALEDNVSLYYTEKGSRKTIKYVDAPVAGNKWHVLRAEFRGNHIRILLDGKAYIELDDTRIAGPGAVGVWTKADSVTAFDDFSFGP